MKSTMACVNKMVKELGVDTPEEDLNRILKVLNDILLSSELERLDAREELKNFASALKSKEEQDRIIQTINTIRNVQAFNRITKKVERAVSGGKMSRIEAIVSILLGNPKLVKDATGEIVGLRHGVVQNQTALVKTYVKDFVDSLTPEHWKAFSSGKFDEDIAIELGYLVMKGPVLVDRVPTELTGSIDPKNLQGGAKSTTPKKHQLAFDIAQSIYDLRIKMIDQHNRAGGFIRFDHNFVMQRTHDPARIRKGFRGNDEAAYQNWKEKVMPLVDESTFRGHPDKDARLRQIFRDALSSDYKERGGVEDPDNEISLSGYSRPSSLAKSAERIYAGQLTFKSPEAQWEYNKQFGLLSLRDAIIAEIMHFGRATGAMQELGADPHGVFRRLMGWAAKMDKETLAPSDRRLKISPQLAFDKVMGYKDRPGVSGKLLHKMVGWAQAIVGTSKLVAVPISSISDTPNAVALLTSNGIPLTEAILNMASAPFARGDKKALIRSLGVALDAYIGEFNAKFSMHGGDTHTGMAKKLLQNLYEISGMNFLNDSNKGAIGLALATLIGEHKKVSYGDLPVELRSKLAMFDISESDWNAIRYSIDTDELTGVTLIRPESLRTLPEAEARKHLPADASFDDVIAYRERIENKIMTFLNDQVEEGVLQPGAREQLLTTMGTQAGTVAGSFARILMYLQSFPITVVSRVLRRELQGMDISRMQKTTRLIGLAVSTTACGYVSMAIKDMLAGKTVRPLFKEDGSVDVSVLKDSMLRGGAGGIYMDILGSEYDNAGRSFVSQRAGPIFGELSQLVGLTSQTIQGAVSDEKEAPSSDEWIKFLARNTPFINMWYTKPVVDQLFIYTLRETLNPGSLREMERSLQDRTGQTFSRDWFDRF